MVRTITQILLLSLLLQVIWIVGQTLAPFDEDQLIPVFGFGDSTTRDVDIFPLTGDDSAPACRGFHDVLDRYNDVVKGTTTTAMASEPARCFANLYVYI
jgi:E3 ubiquitin-protein ligase RGLG